MSETLLQNGVIPIVAARQPVAAQPLFGLDRPALDAVVATLGAQKYRAAQLEQALYRQWAASLDEMTALPQAFRDRLAENGYSVGLPEIRETFYSVDGTERYLIAGLDGQTVETVWMPGGDGSPDAGREDRADSTDGPDGHGREQDTRGTNGPQRRATICVSSQIGCAVNCQFCLTAQMGIVRNLTAGEIAGQVLAVLKQQQVRLSRDRINLVFMGMGEPFLNYDAWIAAFRLLTGPVGLHASRMTVSTSGIVPGILRFAEEPSRPRLAISLNASNDRVREQIMPVTRKWDIEAVLNAVRRVPLGPREKITFEYVLLGGVNDSLDHASELIALVRQAGFPAYVNLIVWNPGPDTLTTSPGRPPSTRSRSVSSLAVLQPTSADREAATSTPPVASSNAPLGRSRLNRFILKQLSSLRYCPLRLTVFLFSYVNRHLQTSRVSSRAIAATLAREQRYSKSAVLRDALDYHLAQKLRRESAASARPGRGILCGSLGNSPADLAVKSGAYAGLWRIVVRSSVPELS